MDQIRTAFNKIFADMTLSENDVAYTVFELGWKAAEEQRRKDEKETGKNQQV